ncbi:hypothetical protein [Peribacillus frigoritolerans]|uniref:hypothetical protein n=1 Tax=Peribacillus frigoritolerans TaxID=450367 RepID=UPI003F7F0F0A
MSSKLILPNPGFKQLNGFLIRQLYFKKGIASTSTNDLNNRALPSITGVNKLNLNLLYFE